MQQWKDDNALFCLVRQNLFVALVGDTLDALGYRDQFLSQGLKPISQEMILIGRAMPVLEADFFVEDTVHNNALSDRPFGYMFEALDDLKENEIYICNGGAGHYALWGGLMSTRAIKCAAKGALLYGYHRDTKEIERLGFPVFSFGSYAKDQLGRGKVIDWRVPIRLDNILIENGDIIYGDQDGVVVIPQKIEKEVFSKALEKAAEEKVVMQALEEGMSSAEVYQRYGIL